MRELLKVYCNFFYKFACFVVAIFHFLSKTLQPADVIPTSSISNEMLMVFFIFEGHEMELLIRDGAFDF